MKNDEATDEGQCLVFFIVMARLADGKPVKDPVPLVLKDFFSKKRRVKKQKELADPDLPEENCYVK